MNRQSLLSACKYLFGIGLLIALAFLVPFDQLLEAFSSLSAEAVVLLLLISVLLIYVSVLKWKLLLEHYGDSPKLLWLYGLYLIGYFVNLLLPSFVGGDAYRSWLVGKRSEQHLAAAATALERYTGFVAMIFLSLGALFLLPEVPVQLIYFVSFVAFGFVVFSLCVLSPHILSFIPSKSSFHRIFQKFQEALHIARKDGSLVFRVMVLSFMFHGVAVLNVAVAGAAVGWSEISLFGLCVVVPLILLVGAIPVSPNGLGLQEGAYLYFLPLVGATPAQALAIGLVLRAKSYVLALIGGGGVCYR